jgi:cysteine desulfurase/selenocysteine lyase
MYDIAKIRSDFPILSREVNGKPLVYLDNGASAQKPQVVIDAITQAYAMEYANVHRGLHYLSNLATEKYEAVRGTIARFLGVRDEEEIVFTSGTTEGINLVAYGWAMPRMEAGDEIVLTIAEHHANIVPWHFLRERQGVVLKWVDVDANGDLDPQAVIDAIGPKTKLVAMTHMSNVLGTVFDVKTVVDAAHARGVPVLVDGSQAAVHMPVDLDTLGRGFLRDHRPQALRSVRVRRDPYKAGADGRDAPLHGRRRHDPRGAPRRGDLERPADEVRGRNAGHRAADRLGVALDYMMGVGMENIAAHEKRLPPMRARGSTGSTG